ncbi:MAG: hypothetical protein ACFB4I_17130 [Cyanophyceae cyanobacterium]
MRWIGCLMMLVAAFPRGAPALAQSARFGQLTLALGFDQASAVVSGHTGGAYSLSSLANRDRHERPCIGYGDPDPDHILTLKNHFPRLSLQVDSGGHDTTLVIQGPNKNFRCEFSSSGDARITEPNWQAGTYKIWVGSMEPRRYWTYRLSVQ